MKTLSGTRIKSVALPIAMMVVMFFMVGCGQDDQSDQTDYSDRTGQADRAEPAERTDRTDRTDPGSAQRRAPADQSAEDRSPLGHVQEFDGYTLRANVNRTDGLSESVAREYGIETDSDLVLLNVVILQDRPNQQPEPVSAVVSAEHRTLSGHVENIDMRAVESDGHFTYIGTFNTSGQRMFPLVIEARPTGADESLQMEFEVQLEAFEDGNHD